MLLIFYKGNDAVSTGKLLCCITDLCYQLKDFKALKENILLLSKRRGQLKQAIKAMIKSVMKYLDEVDYNTKIELIDTLLKVTEGRVSSIFLTIEDSHLFIFRFSLKNNMQD